MYVAQRSLKTPLRTYRPGDVVPDEALSSPNKRRLLLEQGYIVMVANAAEAPASPEKLARKRKEKPDA